MSENNNCDGSGPHSTEPVRVLHLGGGGNLILCYNCYVREMKYRNERNKELGEAFKFDIPMWITLRIYEA